MVPFEEIEHPADLALRVWSETLEGLFADAASGMFHLLGCAGDGDARPVTRQIRVEGKDAETLLIDWLSELLYLSEANLECYDRFEILRVEPPHLEARVHGRVGVGPERDIKAVTYSDLRIRSGAQGFETTITFDV